MVIADADNGPLEKALGPDVLKHDNDQDWHMVSISPDTLYPPT